jgi:PAS domain S-box-containing protein
MGQRTASGRYDRATEDDAYPTPVRRQTVARLGRSPRRAWSLTTQRSADRLLRMQRELGMALAATDDLAHALDLVLAASLQITGIDCGGIYLIDAKTGALDLACHRGLTPAFIPLLAHLPHDAPQALLVKAGQPVYTRHPQIESSGAHLCQGEGLRALAVVPIAYQGQVIAALNLASHTRDILPSATRDAIETIATQVGSVLVRIQSVAELADAQQSWQAIFAALPDMLFVLNNDGIILRVNAAVERCLGYSEAELVGQHVLTVHPPERWDEVTAILAQMLVGQSAVCTVPLFARDGALVAVETRVVRSSQWWGQDVLFGISRDVRERDRMEAALRASEEKYRTFIEQSSEGIVLVDEDGWIIEWNQAMSRITGLPRVDAVGMLALEVNARFALTEASNLDRRRRFEAVVHDVQRSALDGRASQVFEVSVRHADGSVHVLQERLFSIKTQQGLRLGMMLLDITEQRRLDTVMRESEAHHRRLIEEAPLAVAIYDLSSEERTILFANRFARTLWAMAGGETLTGKSALQMGEAQHFAELLARHRDQDWVHGLEARLMTPDGQEMPVLLSAGTITYQGRPAELVFVNDMRELERVRAALKQHEQVVLTLEERERLSRELHDGLGQLLAYLNVQAQATQLLLAETKTDAVQINLQQMAHAARDAQDSIRKHILGLRTHDSASGSLFHTLEAFLRQYSVDSGMPVRLSIPPDAPRPAFAPAVEEQVLRIIQEALANVRKHAAAHQAEICFCFAGEQAQVMISDDGVGFAPALAASASDHFGLRIMAERAAQIGGRLEVRAAPGQGCRVVVYIPRLLPGAGSPTAEELAAIQNLRVLLVDDHPLFLEGIRHLLVARGITVVGVAHDGLEAQAQARALQPDLIVMDVEMPRCDGLAATQAIKAELPHIKIIMLTVAEDADVLFTALRNGASGYLLKSLDANEFCRLLAGVVRGDAPLPPALAARVLSDLARSSQALPTRLANPPLSQRQHEILRQVAQGLTYKEIAAAQHLSEQSIKYHMRQILDLLHVETREQAIAYVSRRLPT